MPKKTVALGAIVVASLLWATAGISAKTMLPFAAPFVIGFWRYALASLCILPFYLREPHKKMTWKTLLVPSLIGALNIPLFYLGIRTTTANSATLIFTASPLVTAILSYFLIKEKNSISKWIGIIFGLFGVSIIIMLPLFTTGRQITGDFQGNLLITMGMLAWTLYAILSKRLRTTYSPVTMTFTSFCITALLCLILAVVTGQPIISSHMMTIPFIATLIYTAVFLTGITYFLYQWAIGYLSVTTASFKQYIETMAAVFLNYLILRETMTVGFIIGSILILSGLTIATVGKTVRRKFWR